MDDQRKREIKQAVNRCWSSIDIVSIARYAFGLIVDETKWQAKSTSSLTPPPSSFIHFSTDFLIARATWFIPRGLSSVIISHGFATHATIFGNPRGNSFDRGNVPTFVNLPFELWVSLTPDLSGDTRYLFSYLRGDRIPLFLSFCHLCSWYTVYSIASTQILIKFWYWNRWIGDEFLWYNYRKYRIIH